MMLLAAVVTLMASDEFLDRIRRDLTAERHDQLLATVEESLDQLTRVAAGLLDTSRP